MPDQSTYERETAYICSIGELNEGEYVVQEGWKPNYVKSGPRKLARVNVMGVVVEKPDVYSFILDDGTGTITVTDFNQQKNTTNLSVGEPVLVIGRPRKSGDTLFIASEIVKANQVKSDPMWLTLRKKQLQRIHAHTSTKSHVKTSPEETAEQRQARTPEQESEEQPIISPALTGDDIIAFVRKKDDGSGCDVDEITDYFGSSAEEVVHALITMGEVYEIRPGKIKVLE
ncbi:MAG: hypothetical protein ACLFTH_00015 [Candidatus Woesearchaeota archaeon]